VKDLHKELNYFKVGLVALAAITIVICILGYIYYCKVSNALAKLDYELKETYIIAKRDMRI